MFSAKEKFFVIVLNFIHCILSLHIEKRSDMESERRREICTKAVNERWHPTTPLAPYNGTLKLGDHEMPCDVLEDGTRLIRRKEFLKAMGRGRIGGTTLQRSIDENLPVFLTANNLTPYLKQEIKLALAEKIFRLPNGKKAVGFCAQALPEACKIYLQARQDKVLNKQQLIIANQCEIMMMAFARVGLDALIDEATGYQYVRDRNSLQKLLEKYVYDEVREWTKKFPDEFFQQAYKIHGWQYPRLTGKNHPQYLGKFINKYVYDKMPPGVLEELKRKNPANQNGNRQHRHHQFLTEDIGNEKLKDQLNRVTTIMKISDNMEEFKNYMEKL